jgi:hypothetical protein
LAALLLFQDQSVPFPDTSGDTESPSLREKANPIPGKESRVLWTILLMLLIFWILGLLNDTSLGGVIHILPVMAIIAMVFQVEADCSHFVPRRTRLKRAKRRVVNRSGELLPKLVPLSGEKVSQSTMSSQTY